MKRLIVLLTALAAVLYLGGVPAFAQRGHGGGRGGGGMAGGPSQPSMGQSPMTSAPDKDSMHGKGSMPEERRESKEASKREKEVKETKATNATVADRLARNTELNSKLQALLPAGTTVRSAAGGFKNLGQFVAAVHVSHNLNIPFDQLKAKMVGSPSLSLGKAIQELKPGVNAKAEAHKAEREAKDDMRESRS